MRGQDNKPTCEVCRLIRNYLIIAVPIIIVIYIPNFGFPAIHALNIWHGIF